MNRVILFSPVGGTDPMPQTNFRDGSMLHICRVYQPTDVYLYMSAEILELHKQDNRYLYCLEQLGKQQSRSIHSNIIERPELRDVQVFDWFYQDFRQEIKKISEGMDDTDTLLLNVSSGTPAMKSGLLVLATLGEYPCKLIQVRTPIGKMNEHHHKGYDIHALWELNEDNEDDFENRCQEISCPNLMVLKQEEIIKQMISSYDYKAAMEICDMMPKETTKAYRPLLEMAYARIQLDFDTLRGFLDKKIGMNCIPIRKEKEKQVYFEYALNMDIKRRKREYVDFVRSITPLIMVVFQLILLHGCDIDIRKYCFRNEDEPLKWDRNRLQKNASDIDNLLCAAYTEFRYGVVYSAHLLLIIKKYANDEKLVSLAEHLRDVEESVRNRAAHEIVSLSDAKIKALTKYDTEGIMGLVKEAFKFMGIGANEAIWDSYDKMNEEIISAMK